MRVQVIDEIRLHFIETMGLMLLWVEATKERELQVIEEMQLQEMEERRQIQ